MYVLIKKTTVQSHNKLIVQLTENADTEAAVAEQFLLCLKQHLEYKAAEIQYSSKD